MTNQSPWRMLAERLGVVLHDEGGVLLDDCHQLELGQTQDLLIGRALRVANDKQGGERRSWPNWKEIEWLRLQVTEKFVSDDLALAALELLDAVGYKGA